MTAVQLAERALRWALEPSGPVPSGSLSGTVGLADLADHGAELLPRIGVVAARHLARLRWRSPPLGDARGPAADLILLALAVVDEAAAPALLTALAPPLSAWDRVARDAIAAPGLRSRSVATADLLRQCSPLTALRDRPAPGDEDRGLAQVVALADHQDGRRWLVRTFADPLCPPDVLAWRTRVLDRLRHTPAGRTLVLDIHATALVRHADGIAAATATALGALASEHDGLLAWALGLGRWWDVLFQLDRSDPDAVRSHRALDPDALRGGRELAVATRNLQGVGA